MRAAAISAAAAFPAQVAGCVAAAFVLGGVDASPAWTLAGAAAPCAMAFAGAVSKAIAERRALRSGAIACDIAPDPLDPDLKMVATGMVEAMSRSIVESRQARIRFLPCGSIPYLIAILPPKRSSNRPRLAVKIRESVPSSPENIESVPNSPAVKTRESVPNETRESVPIGPEPRAFSCEIPFVSVRMKMPVTVEGGAETVWAMPTGKGRARLSHHPAGSLAPDHAAIGAAVAAAAALAAFGHFRESILALAAAALHWFVRSSPTAWLHVAWLSAIALTALALGDAFPALPRDPVRLLLYAYALPLAIAAAAVRLRARFARSSVAPAASDGDSAPKAGKGK